MFQPLKKLLQNSFLRNLVSKAKLTFSRKAKTQSIFTQLSRKSFDGCSFITSILCLSVKPSEEDLYQHFESLNIEVNNFFDFISTHLPSLHEILLLFYPKIVMVHGKQSKEEKMFHFLMSKSQLSHFKNILHQ